MRNFNVTVDGKTYSVQVEEVGASAQVTVPVEAVAAPVAPVAPVAAPKAAAPAGGTQVTAPMPGMVLDFKVANGAAVKKGDVVAVLEAMKMENDISATADGVITLVAQKGATVNTGDVLATIN